MKTSIHLLLSLTSCLTLILCQIENASCAPNVKPQHPKLQYIKPTEAKYDTSSPSAGYWVFNVHHDELLPSEESVLLKGQSGVLKQSAPLKAGVGKTAPLSGSANNGNLKAGVSSSTPLNGAATGGNLKAGAGKLAPLNGNVDATNLKAGVQKNDNKLKAGAGKLDNRALTGETKDNSNPLKGNVHDTALNTTVNTYEHGIKPKFYIDLQKLTPKFAPKLTRLLDTELEQARLTIPKQVSIAEKQMNQELKARPPQTAGSITPGKLNIGALPSKELKAAIQQSKQQQQLAINQGAKDMKAANLKSAGTGGPLSGIPQPSKIPPLQMPSLKPDKAAPLAIPTVPKTNLSSLQEAMNAELAGARNPVSKSGFPLEVENAKQQTKIALASAKPGMDIVLTSLRKPNNLHIPTPQELAQQQAQPESYEEILWDRWHAKFAEIAKSPILNCLREAGSPAGDSTVEITVTSDKHISARIIRPSNASFDKAVVRAYQSLDGNAALKYPDRSRRSTLSFAIDVKHSGLGIPSGVQSQTATGDKETVKKPR